MVRGTSCCRRTAVLPSVPGRVGGVVARMLTCCVERRCGAQWQPFDQISDCSRPALHDRRWATRLAASCGARQRCMPTQSELRQPRMPVLLLAAAGAAALATPPPRGSSRSCRRRRCSRHHRFPRSLRCSVQVKFDHIEGMDTVYVQIHVRAARPGLAARWLRAARSCVSVRCQPACLPACLHCLTTLPTPRSAPPSARMHSQCASPTTLQPCTGQGTRGCGGGWEAARAGGLLHPPQLH